MYILELETPSYCPATYPAYLAYLHYSSINPKMPRLEHNDPASPRGSLRKKWGRVIFLISVFFAPKVINILFYILYLDRPRKNLSTV